MASDDIHPRTSDAENRGATETSPLGVVRAARGDQTPVITGYEIIRELHRGGQGVVYEALQRSAKRKVAIKVMLAGPFSSKAARKRFEREVELVAQLKHPNIIPVFHSGETDQGLPFFVMEYVRGTRLDHFIREKKPPLEEVLSLFAKVCEAVQYAHQRGVIHRDLKPSNIIVDFEGTPRVLDFGLAKLLAGPVETVVSVSAEILGTIPYMSPEQVRGNPDEIDTRSDVYALGVVLYELLTGRLPYPSSSQMAELIRHIAETPPSPPSAVWSTESGVTERTRKRSRPGHCPIDDEVETIVLKALSKDRARRYQSAGELSRDLGHYLVGEPIEASRDSGWYILKTTLRRYRARVAIAGSAIAALIIFAIVLAAQNQKVQHALAETQHAKAAEQTQRFAAEAAAAKEAAARTDVEAAKAIVERRFYFNQISEAERALDMEDYRRAREILDNCPEEFRNFEWNRLKWLSDKSVLMMRGHERIVWSVAFSPVAPWLASGDTGGSIRVWDIVEGREARAWKAHEAGVASLAWNSEGTLLASGGADHLVHVWQFPSGERVASLRAHEDNVTRILFSSAMEHVYTAGRDGAVCVWDASDWHLIRRIQVPDRVVGLDLSDDGSTLVTMGTDSNIVFIRANTGETIQHVEASDLTDVRFVRGVKGIVASGHDGKLYRWGIGTGNGKTELDACHGPVWSLRPLGGGRLLALCPDGWRLIDPDHPEAPGATAYMGAVNDFSVTTDNCYGASAGPDASVRVWRLADGPFIKLEHASTVISPSLGGDVYADWDGTYLSQRDAACGALLRSARMNNVDLDVDVDAIFGPHIALLLDSVDEKHILVVFKNHVIETQVGAGRSAQFFTIGTGFDAVTGALLWSYKTEVPVAVAADDHSEVHLLFTEPNEVRIRTLRASDGTVANERTGFNSQLELPLATPWRLINVALCSDGQTIAASGRVFSIESGGVRFMARIPQLSHPMAFTSDCQRLAGMDSSGAVYLWDVETGAETMRMAPRAGTLGIRFGRGPVVFVDSSSEPAVLQFSESARSRGLWAFRNAAGRHLATERIRSARDLAWVISQDRQLDEALRKRLSSLVVTAGPGVIADWWTNQVSLETDDLIASLDGVLRDSDSEEIANAVVVSLAERLIDAKQSPQIMDALLVVGSLANRPAITYEFMACVLGRLERSPAEGEHNVGIHAVLSALAALRLSDANEALELLARHDHDPDLLFPEPDSEKTPSKCPTSLRLIHKCVEALAKSRLGRTDSALGALQEAETVAAGLSCLSEPNRRLLEEASGIGTGSPN